MSPSFPRFWAAAAALLMAVTWPLWWPPVDSQYPAIPFVTTSPLWLLRTTTIGTLACLSCVLFSKNDNREGWFGAGFLLSLSFLLDQHRMQPWAYQTAIYAIVFTRCNDKLTRRIMIPLAASVYFYSALGKFDFQFMHTVGQEFLNQAMLPFGNLLPEIHASVAPKLALIFPAVEMLVAVGLLIPQTRRFAAVVVMVMHASLIFLLGPWGLNHSTGVLVWNAALLGQAYLLFFRDSMQEALLESGDANAPSLARVQAWFAIGLAALVMIAPIGERFGFWDHWLSWSLYSPHTSRATIELHRSALEKLPDEIIAHLADDVDDDGWRQLDIEQWSLQNRWVPVYPQSRYHVQLAAKISKRHQLDREVRVIRKSVSDRWTGHRDVRRLIGLAELEQ